MYIRSGAYANEMRIKNQRKHPKGDFLGNRFRTSATDQPEARGALIYLGKALAVNFNAFIILVNILYRALQDLPDGI